MTTQATSFQQAVKIRLLERQMTVTDLAKELGKARNTVSLAINHETMFPTIKDLIRKALNLS